MHTILIASAALLFAAPALAQQKERTRFWNLTANEINALHLSPAGTDKWGANLCAGDKDGGVDHDERLRITGVSTGRYDVKLSDKTGRTCIVKNVEVKAGDIFSIEERDLKECKK